MVVEAQLLGEETFKTAYLCTKSANLKRFFSRFDWMFNTVDAILVWSLKIKANLYNFS